MPFCAKCGKKFRRMPIHKRKYGVINKNRAKLCLKCRKSKTKCAICNSKIENPHPKQITCSEKCRRIHILEWGRKYRKRKKREREKLKNSKKRNTSERRKINKNG